jgi:hypothetical protein
LSSKISAKLKKNALLSRNTRSYLKRFYYTSATL